ncbi:MAG: hypothetical protein PUP91_25195 [Rhizonema sp. PD37]|nr:hypothetical protein [Rhizonema sp. PD37]
METPKTLTGDAPASKIASHLRRETLIQCWTHRAASPVAIESE